MFALLGTVLSPVLLYNCRIKSWVKLKIFKWPWCDSQITHTNVCHERSTLRYILVTQSFSEKTFAEWYGKPS